MDEFDDLYPEDGDIEEEEDEDFFGDSDLDDSDLFAENTIEDE